MKKFFLLLLLLFPFIAYPQATVAWNQPMGGVSLALDRNNNVYTANWDYNPAGDITLTKRDQHGNFKWDAKYDNLDNTRHEVATWVATDPQGNIFVTGTSRSGYSNPVNAASLVMKFDSSGNLLWRNVYESSFDGSSTKKCIVDGTGNVYVLGLGSGTSGMVTKVKKFSPSGAALWSYFDTAGIGAPMNIKFTPDNKILIVCRGITGSINGFAKITKAGVPVWSLPGVNSLTAGDAAGDAFGNTYVVSGSYPVTTATTLRKMDPTGTQIWQHNYALSAFRVEVGKDNLPVACGFPNSGSGGASFVKTDSAGSLLWANANADSVYSFLLHAQLMMDAYNNIYLAAGILNGMGVCKVNSNGSSAWTIVTTGGYSNAFALGKDFSVYVCGGGATARILQPAPCITPGGNFTDALSSFSARLNWTALAGALQYEVWYRKTTAPTWRKRLVNGTSKKLNLSNLSCNTDYEWKIRLVCDTTGITAVSNFSPVSTFSTLACPPRIGDATSLTETLSFYPNPAADIVYLSLPDAGPGSLALYDPNGRRLWSQELPELAGEDDYPFDVSALPDGLYFLWLESGSRRFAGKLMLQH